MKDQREYTFDFSKYKYVINDKNNDFRVYRYDEDRTDMVMNNPLLDLMIGYDNLANRITSKEYINKIAVEELFRDEIKEIQNSDSDCKRVLIDELERLLYYILQIPELELEQEG